jgi:16S rRNA processing protein RimM
MESGRSSDWDDLVLVGVIARPRGIRGEVIVNPVTDFVDERFREGAVLQARRPGAEVVETMTIDSVRVHLGRPIVGFAGVHSMDEAGRLAGAELRVSPEVQHALPEGIYYHRELVGCEVVTEEGEAIGRVTRIEGETSQSRLVVQTRRGEVLIPFVQAICPHVDAAARRILVRPPEGLLEVNATRFTADALDDAPPETGSGGA